MVFPLNNVANEPEASISACNVEELSQLLLSAQEEERQRIAADLHDEIGQCLSAIQFAFGGLRQRLEDRMTDAEEEMCATLTRRIAQAIEDVRRICAGLRPPMLDDLGVISTIDWYCSELRQVLIGMEVVQDLRAQEGAIPSSVKLAIFRILQEACANACKYSGAQRLSVHLETDAEGIRLEVADNGVGFGSMSNERIHKGSGIASMRERAAMTDGCLIIGSQPGKGTCVRAVWRAKGACEGISKPCAVMSSVAIASTRRCVQPN